MAEYINPTKESFREFREAPAVGKIHMLNLVKFHELAQYDDGRKATGAEAYATYGAESGPIFRALGGQIIWAGRPEVMLIGPGDAEDWDRAFIAEYPDLSAFVSMIRDPDYQRAAIHRTAGVKDSRLIRMAPLEAGAGFGD